MWSSPHRPAGKRCAAALPTERITRTAALDIAEVKAETDRTEVQTLERLTELPMNQVQRIELLGKLTLYDKELSVNPKRVLPDRCQN